ncbi:MAG TPA: prolipoprotein diacylglyceryl transferase family protein [Polyangiaceae bacterium]|jgi:prolipoprotein diacylglyceryltransferase
MRDDASFPALDRFFDALPRTRLFRRSRARPSFRSLGVAGYYAALVVTFVAGLVGGRSLLVLAAVAAACGGSFFVWAYARRALTGREQLVLLEHVWFAELVAAGTLRLLGEPILPYLDAVSVGLAVFLAFGRVGCLLAGCCYGRPASIGIRYGDEAAHDGFSRHLVGVRLFPVPALEALLLLAVAAVGFGFVCGSVDGRALAWFLASYAVLRFGLEGLRGDARAHFFGLSQARWMAIVELAAAIALVERGQPSSAPRKVAVGALLAALAVGLVVRCANDPRRRLLSRAHVAELRALVRACIERARPDLAVPEVGRTSQWVSVGVSLVGDVSAHLSLCLPDADHDLRLLCELAVRALPELDPRTAALRPATLLHLRAPLVLAEDPRAPEGPTLDSLYGVVLQDQPLHAPRQPAPIVEPLAVHATHDRPSRPAPAFNFATLPIHPASRASSADRTGQD